MQADIFIGVPIERDGVFENNWKSSAILNLKYLVHELTGVHTIFTFKIMTRLLWTTYL